MGVIMEIKRGNYDDLIALFKSLNEKYDSCNNKDYFFVYLWDKKKYSPADFRGLYNDAYSLLTVGDNMSHENLQLMLKMDKVSLDYNEFYDSFFHGLTYHQIDGDMNDLYQLFDLIDDFLKQKNSLNLLIYYLIDVKNILYKNIVTYNKMVNTYCIERLRGNVPDFKLKSVYNFNRLFSSYRVILRQSDYLVSLINKNDEKLNKFLYYVLRNNGVSSNALGKNLKKFNDSLISKFISRYDKYRYICSKREEEKKHDDRLSIAVNTIRNYLDGSYYSLERYCNLTNITVAAFENYVNLVKEAGNPIYDEYFSFSEEQRSTKFSLLMDKFRLMISLIKNGVIEDGVKRDFNILDYYSYTKLPFDEVKRIIKGKVSNFEYGCFSRFCSNYDDKILNEKAKRDLLDTDINFFCKISKEGEIVDTGYSVNEYDKQHVINMLRSKNIPITFSTYSAMLNEYIDIKLDKKNTIK